LNQAGPLTGTSANHTGQPPAQSAKEVIEQLGPQIDLILDGGLTPGGQPSTVLQVGREIRILRAGAIPTHALQKAIGASRKILL